MECVGVPAKVGGDVFFALGNGGLEGSAAPAERVRREGVVAAVGGGVVDVVEAKRRRYSTTTARCRLRTSFSL